MSVWCVPRCSGAPAASPRSSPRPPRAIRDGPAVVEVAAHVALELELEWVKVLALPTFKRTTQHGYLAVLRTHVLPTWQDIPLRDIDRLAIQQWVVDRFRQRVGWQSVRNAWTLLSSILESAVEYGYLQANPARGV